MNLFKSYYQALQSKWYFSLIKWINKTGVKRVVFSLLLVLLAAFFYMYNLLFNGPIDTTTIIIEDWTWRDDLLFYSYYLLAIPLISLNGIAWIISGLKFNLIFILELILLYIFLFIYYSDYLTNLEILAFSFVCIGVIVILLPNQSKRSKQRDSRNARERHSRHRSSSKRRSSSSHNSSMENSNLTD